MHSLYRGRGRAIRPPARRSLPLRLTAGTALGLLLATVFALGGFGGVAALTSTSTTGTDSFGGTYALLTFSTSTAVTGLTLTFPSPATSGAKAYCQVPVNSTYPANYDRSVHNASAWLLKWTIDAQTARGSIQIGLNCSTTAVLVTTGTTPAPTLSATGTQATATVGATPTTIPVTNTSVPATATSTTMVIPSPTPDHSSGTCSGAGLWTPPGADGSEHGDAPPAWIANAGYTVCFDGPFNTSAAENTSKHAAMKGFSFPNAGGTGQDLYLRIHAASNPGDRSARFHSYEGFIRGTNGAVSHFSGWYDAGDPAPYPGGARVPRTPNGDPGTRGVILVTDQATLNAGISCEQWYPAPAGYNGEATWTFDIGWTICNSTTVYDPNENSNPDIYNASTWNATGDLGLTRRLEFSWYANRSNQRGDFWTDQFGASLSGQNDPRVGTTVAIGGKSYTIVALKQHIDPGLQTIAFPNNAAQKTFDGTGVHLPN